MKIRPEVGVVLAAAMFGSTALHASDRHLHAHEHGVSSLKIAQENNKFLFELEAPGNDIVGFEHAAKNDDQKAAIDKALAEFAKPQEIFALSSDAGCKVADQEAEFETEDDHAGFHVKWSMTCDNPEMVKSMNIKFFDMFERAEEVEVEAIGNAGQAAMEVEKGETSVDLSSAVGG
ncbi:MAG: DUF2796 domain-containing protein [Pseudomonadota bacterium]